MCNVRSVVASVVAHVRDAMHPAAAMAALAGLGNVDAKLPTCDELRACDARDERSLPHARGRCLAPRVTAALYTNGVGSAVLHSE
jgi:hypothetical protein